MFGMGIIFAFVVAAQIHTGSDLLAACQQRDTTACDAFIEQLVANEQCGAVEIKDRAALRGHVVQSLRNSTDLARPAREALMIVLNDCFSTD